MTATGIALIAGGLATLICFGKLLWSGQGRRRGRAGTKRRAARTRAIEGSRQTEPVADIGREEDERAGLASIGLADEESTGSDEDEFQQFDESADPVLDHVDADAIPSGRAEEPDPPTGDYWMPVPHSAYADLDSAGYALPVRDGRDPAAESEPTAIVPLWPPARPSDRIGMPRNWSEGPRLNRRTLRETAGRRQHRADDAGGHWDQLDRNGRDSWWRHSGPEDERLALPGAQPRRRPRPRPNPAAEARSTVYVSRHAAE